MEATIKTVVFKNGTVVISQIEEVESELGDPNCKLIRPCEIKKEKITEGIYLQNWLCDYTKQEEFLVNSDSILTIINPNSDIIKKYIDLIS
jgi:hypothetical protein